MAGEKNDLTNTFDDVNLIHQLVEGRDCLLKTHDPRMIECKIGTEKLSFLIDSGATVNTITLQAWEALKRNCKTVIQDIVMLPKEVLTGYANKKPMDVLCTFKAYVEVSVYREKRSLAKFFVIKGTNLSLLGYDTACELMILSIGPMGSINWTELSGENVTRREFPKVPIESIKFRVNREILPKQIIRYNIPKAFERWTNQRLQVMLGKGIIERADKENYIISNVSPLVLVPKRENDFRIVVDYRELNKAIIREPYPMPSLEKIWTAIPSGAGRLYFSKLDLKDAYFHIELHEDVRHHTAFMTSKRLMRFKRLPFGLSCAPELFQKVMEKILIHCKNIIVYLDDILAFADNLPGLRVIVQKVYPNKE